jgi:sugar lactone lactonase YvrE
VLQRIQRLPLGQRILIFALIFGGGLFILVAITILLIRSSLTPATRSMGQSLDLKSVTVSQFAALPDDDAYPAALAVASDGRVYTGSYKTGKLWVITPQGEVTTIATKGEALKAITGLAAAPDGSLYIVDQTDADPRTDGGSVKRMAADGTVTAFANIPDAKGFVSPDDVTLDAVGHVYVSDRARAEVWRFNPDGSGGLAWWTPPKLDGVDHYAPTGLAFDASHNAIVLTDSINDTIYRVPVDSPDKSELLYWHKGRANPPGFDGLTVTPQGVIYLAALGQRGIARLDGENLTYIAGLFRGPSDVDYAAPDKLYVTNWDQFSLAVTASKPSLPFALDVIRFVDGSATATP